MMFFVVVAELWGLLDIVSLETTSKEVSTFLAMCFEDCGNWE